MKLVCTGCGREIERCAFCDANDCPKMVCHRCVLYDLDEARPVVPRSNDDD